MDMTTIEGHHEDGSVLCAVRALTEGRAKEWVPEEPAEVTGVVLRQGTQPSRFSISGPVPFIELWLGGTERTRVTGHGSMLSSLIVGAELQVGDTVTVRYLGKRVTEQRATGKTFNYKVYEVEVQRGHR
jgi:hypothetical protein